MLDQPDTGQFRRREEEIESRRVPLGEVAHWFAPWTLAGVLALVFFGALWCASGATDNGTYILGLVGAVLALLALVWELHAALSGGIGALSVRWLVDDEATLVVLAGILTVLALGGLILASWGDSGAAIGTGYGLFVFSIVIIAANLKHYFDRHEG